MYCLPTENPMDWYSISEIHHPRRPGHPNGNLLKGCPLRCKWCSNPESLIRTRNRRLSRKMLGTKKLHRIASTHARFGAKHSDSIPRRRTVRGSYDAVMLRLLSVCGHLSPRALKALGRKKDDPPRLMEIIEEDRCFYDRSGGGVTLNGGEVMLQWEFARDLLRNAGKRASIPAWKPRSTAPRRHMEAVFEFTDLVINDIKCMDSNKHRFLHRRRKRTNLSQHPSHCKARKDWSFGRLLCRVQRR